MIDIACLCSSSAYVSALSCCLYTACSTDEQASKYNQAGEWGKQVLTMPVAIQFNKQECEAVNETAPDFVGCSPAGLSSALSSASAEQATRASFGSASATAGTSATSSSPSGVSIITGDVVSEFPPTQTAKRLTADFAGRPLMTGGCNVPYFAVATGAPGMVTQYPIIGCSDGRQDCCPFDPSANAVLTRCPQDHFTTAGGCCPM